MNVRKEKLKKNDADVLHNLVHLRVITTPMTLIVPHLRGLHLQVTVPTTAALLIVAATAVPAILLATKQNC